MKNTVERILTTKLNNAEAYYTWIQMLIVAVSLLYYFVEMVENYLDYLMEEKK